MSFLGEIYGYIRERKRYWLLPVLVPILVGHGLIVASRGIIQALQNLRSVTPAAPRKLDGGFVALWSRPYLRHSRRA